MIRAGKADPEKVLLTGISGYIGLHCAKELLLSGFKVRGTIRKSRKQKQVQEVMATENVDLGNLEFALLDLTSDNGWESAMHGCDYVMHIASPFRIANPKNDAEMTVPAVDGTNRVMRAAKNAKIKRVILTSSIVAMMASIRRGLFKPDDWTDLNYPNLSTYIKSKTLAERAAWTFLDENKGSSLPDLVVIAPGGVFGPPLGSDISGQSLTVLAKMLDGKVPMVPDAAFPMVDVRDVARLHVMALKKAGVAGSRFIASGTDPVSFADAAQILLDDGYKGPSTKIAPRWLLKILSIFDREAKGMLALVGIRPTADNSTTCDVFNWVPIPFRRSLIETASAIDEIKNRKKID